LESELFWPKRKSNIVAIPSDCLPGWNPLPFNSFILDIPNELNLLWAKEKVMVFCYYPY